ncbi:hypothetical protein AYO40_06660 [Planctomycetaceae bacterium SCGC AG-212-D15]|nr:hypothetical protein AYO40_06660 [Planctomycetaceae bacterium SCGC AG-212-D15]
MSHLRMPRPGGLFLGAVVAMSLVAVPSRGADPASLDTSLKFVPAEAAFYSATLRNREQFDAIAKSKAWARLMELPFIQTAWKEASAELNKKGGALEQLEAFRKDPENQQLLDLGMDMLSTEFFFYGDESVNQVLDLYSRVQGASRFGTILAMAKGENKGMEVNELQLHMTMKSLQDNIDLIKVPDLVFGFRLKDTERAEAQIKRLETLIKGPINQQPMLKGRLKRVPLGGKDFLTFTLDGAMIPWEEIWTKVEKEEGEFDKLKKKLKSMTLSISMGVRGQYMLVSIGASTKHLTKLGKPTSLATRPEFQPLAKHTDKRIIDIGYVSKDLRTKFAFTKKDFDEYATLGREALKNAEQIPEALKKRLEKDLDDLIKDVRPSIADVGPLMSFTFMTSTGQESFAYDWSEHLSSDGSKPLSIVQHLGGGPLLAVANRGKYSPETYATFVKWAKNFYSYVDDFVLQLLRRLRAEDLRRQREDRRHVFGL